jgi:hypothetical protein
MDGNVTTLQKSLSKAICKQNEISEDTEHQYTIINKQNVLSSLSSTDINL